MNFLQQICETIKAKEISIIVNGQIDWTSPANPNSIIEDVKCHPSLSEIFKEGERWIHVIDDDDEEQRDDRLRVVAISDTHSFSLYDMELPPGDILIISGDLTQHGTEKEIRHFEKELGKIFEIFTKKFKHQGIEFCSFFQWSSKKNTERFWLLLVTMTNI